MNYLHVPGLEEKAFMLLKMYEPLALDRNEKGYIVGYSGGKDSDALVELFYRSGVKHHIIHNHTTIDAPETVYYIRRRFKEFEARGQTTEVIKPKKNMFSLIVERGIFPTRLIRFCCSDLKEAKKPEYAHAVYSFGVRKAESAKRKVNRDNVETRNSLKGKAKLFKFDDQESYKAQLFHFDDENARLVTVCYTNNYTVINPMAYWTEAQVWSYLAECGLTKENINPLYKQGAKRVGCLGCPMNRKSKAELDRYPKYRALYVKAAQAILDGEKADKLKEYFKDGEEYVKWWLSGKSIANYLEDTDE